MRTRVKAYRFSWAVARRLPTLIRSAHASLWLHVLDSRDLAELTVLSYVGRSGFEVEEHNLGGLSSWEAEEFPRRFSGCEKILVAGAGGGREMIALARMGFDVTGFDASPTLTAACRTHLHQAGIRAEVHDAPPSAAPGTFGRCDGLLIGRGVYHHIAGRMERIAFLTGCARHLRPGAPVIIGDFLTRTRTKPQAMEFAFWMAKEPGDFINSAYFHFFTQAELREELEAAGFELLGFRMTAPGENELAHAFARLKQ